MHGLSNVEFRRNSSAEVLGFSVGSTRGGNVADGGRGGKGGGDKSSLGGRIGAFGACLACIQPQSEFFNDFFSRESNNYLHRQLLDADTCILRKLVKLNEINFGILLVAAIR